MRSPAGACGSTFGRLLARYGPAAARANVAELLDYTERMARDEIRRWPKGAFTFVDHIDDDGFSDAPIPIRVTLTVHEDGVTVDFAGTSPQVKGAINSTRSFTKSATYLSVRCALTGEVPNNAGLFRCVEIRTPRGSILDPYPPAPCAARALTGYRVVDAMFGALAQVAPERMPAAGEGGNSVVCIGGYRGDGRTPFIVVDMICGAWGGRPHKDGIEAVTNPSQNMSNTPVETLELRQPVRIERHGFAPDSCGAGKHRGGLGLVREYTLLAPEALLQLHADRRRFPPYGLAGGRPAAPSRNVLHTADGGVRELPSKVTMTMRAGDRIAHVQPGGGGFGDPLERDPALVLRDVYDEKVTAEYARREHGVAIDTAGWAVDEAATLEARRAARMERASRPMATSERG